MMVIIYGILEFTILFLAFFYVISERPSIRQLLMYASGVVFPTILISFYANHIASILYMVAATLLLYYSFVRSIFSFITVCVIIVSAIISDHFSMLLQPLLYNLFGEWSAASTVVLNVLTLSLLIYLYKQLIYRQFQMLDLPWYIQVALVTVLLSTVLVVYMNVFDAAGRSNEIILLNLFIQAGYFIAIMVLCSLLFIYMRKRNAIHQKEMEQKQFLQYMKELELVNQDMHKFRHDYVNILLTMRGFLDDNNLEGLRTYFHEHIIKVEQQTLKHNLMFMQFKNIKIQELKGLIATKLITAEKNKIFVNVEIPDLITSVDMDIIDLARVTGILLDNAIEASESVDHARINLGMIHTIQGHVLIIVENRTTLENCNVHRIFEENYSTKGKHRGLGLATVNKIVSRYPNVQLETLTDQNWFTQRLTIRTIAATGPAVKTGSA
ncbi:sensor histidine kinase [Paenibacillus septentrionalis]|uniref:Sensor histidine kinase n=1 Tax=Paenibacillus septentrionalis TaxID=429342 RepID=A0ABW1V688_9BACL